MPTKKATPSIYQLKITLLEISPRIWRRVQVPSSMRLDCIHDVFQIVMGWTDSHLHQFEKDGNKWGPDWAGSGERDLIDESKTPVARVLNAEGDSIRYLYDFGDNWRHEVVLEKILPAENMKKPPICLGGERRFPPEDVGGISGYQEFLEITSDRTHEEYEDTLEWAGGHFDAEAFDLELVNKKLAAVRWPIRQRRLRS